MKIVSAAITDVGKKREINEDNFYISKDDGLYLLADGMGGHLAGDMASKLAVDTIASFIKSTGVDREVTWPYRRDEKLPYEANRLIIAIKFANKKIFNVAKEKELTGMGTTVASLLFHGENVYLCHVGDSRAYRIRNGKIAQLTEDHSLLNFTMKTNPMTTEEIENFPFKNVITRAIGIEEDVEVDMNVEQISEGDYYLLCSDGLSNFVSDEQIVDTVVKGKKDLLKACKGLISHANNKGGGDNITVVLTHVE